MWAEARTGGVERAQPASAVSPWSQVLPLGPMQSHLGVGAAVTAHQDPCEEWDPGQRVPRTLGSQEGVAQRGPLSLVAVGLSQGTEGEF